MIKILITKIKLHFMDLYWFESHSYHTDLFPPSFYATHSPEEIKETGQKAIEQLQEKIKDL